MNSNQIELPIALPITNDSYYIEEINNVGIDELIKKTIFVIIFCITMCILIGHLLYLMNISVLYILIIFIIGPFIGVKIYDYCKYLYKKIKYIY